MKPNDLKNIIHSCTCEIIFNYNQKRSGITAEVEDSFPTYQVWHGNDTKEYTDIDVLMNDPFFSGKSLNDLCEGTDFTFV